MSSCLSSLIDRDGQNEAVITYVCGNHSSGAKVIRFREDGYEVVFKHSSNTPNTQFEVIEGTPIFIFEESDYKRIM